MAETFLKRLTVDATSGAWFDQTRRYMLIRPEALMGIFKRLPPPEQCIALAALEASIFEQGSDSARAYRAMGGEGDALMAVVAASAPELGWGTWAFAKDNRALRLTVRNSPFAAGFGPSAVPVCAAITGMLRAVSTLVLDAQTQARELQCASMGGEDCIFEAWTEAAA